MPTDSQTTGTPAVRWDELLDNNLPERLRSKANWLESRSFATLYGDIEREAADTVEKLREEVRRLRSLSNEGGKR